MSKLKVVLGGVALGALGYGVKKLKDNLDKKIADKENLYFGYTDAIVGETIKGSTKLVDRGLRGMSNIYERFFDEPLYGDEYWSKEMVELQCKEYESKLGDLSPNLTKELKHSLVKLAYAEEVCMWYFSAHCNKEYEKCGQEAKSLNKYINKLYRAKNAINAYEDKCLEIYKSSIEPMQKALASDTFKKLAEEIEFNETRIYADGDKTQLRENIASKYAYIEANDELCTTLESTGEILSPIKNKAQNLAKDTLAKIEKDSLTSKDVAQFAKIHNALVRVVDARFYELEHPDETLQKSLQILQTWNKSK